MEITLTQSEVKSIISSYLGLTDFDLVITLDEDTSKPTNTRVYEKCLESFILSKDKYEFISIYEGDNFNSLKQAISNMVLSKVIKLESPYTKTSTKITRCDGSLTPQEIIKSYEEAEDKERRIKVLAEINNTTYKEISDIIFYRDTIKV